MLTVTATTIKTIIGEFDRVYYQESTEILPKSSVNVPTKRKEVTISK